MSLEARTWLGVTLALLMLGRLAPAHAARPPACPQTLQFLQSDCARWRADLLPLTLPDARGNAFADRDDAAALGMRIFYDNRFSQPGSGVACASCHDPEHSFAETKARSHTIAELTRNAPDLINAAWYEKWHFWDGKVDNLWSAPLYTFEQPAEMGSSRLQVVRVLATIYKPRYEKIFGPLPDLSDPKRFPASGKPGEPAFDTLAAQDKRAVDEVYANVGKALEAYIRKLAAGRSPFDDFVAGVAVTLSPAAQRGMVAFSHYDCQSCHAGPLFTDERFHAIATGKSRLSPADPGRALGLSFARSWEFSSGSRFAEPAENRLAEAERASSERGAFRTPSLRNVALTPPYGHDGSYATLEQAIDAHAAVLPRHKMVPPQDKADIVEFLRALSGRPPRRPWNYWPGG